MKGEVIALEGVCCAGKTTLLRQLAGRLKAGTIPELPEFGRNLFRPFTDNEAILYNAHRSIAIEKVRMIGAIGLSDIAPHVILDRSFLSTLALGYGAIDLIGAPAYKGLADRVLSAMSSGDLPAPDKTLYIHVDGATVQKRNETRIPRLDEYWVNPERITRQNEFYQALASVTGIELVQGTREREEVLADCVERSRHAPTVSCGQEIVSVIQDFNKYIK